MPYRIYRRSEHICAAWSRTNNRKWFFCHVNGKIGQAYNLCQLSYNHANLGRDTLTSILWGSGRRRRGYLSHFQIIKETDINFVAFPYGEKYYPSFQLEYRAVTSFKKHKCKWYTLGKKSLCCGTSSIKIRNALWFFFSPILLRRNGKLIT